jgi:hypothetical protein
VDDMVAALVREYDGYMSVGRTERAAMVKAELARRGLGVDGLPAKSAEKVADKPEEKPTEKVADKRAAAAEGEKTTHPEGRTSVRGKQASG